MKVLVKKWGNSAAVRIPASVMEAAHLNLDQSVDVKEERGRIVIEPDRSGVFSLQELVTAITSENLHGPVDTGPAVGRGDLVMARAYIPEAGDVVWLEFSPQAGHEQAGHRPALVLSPAIYNGRTGMMICCPMTTQIKGYPFEVVISTHPPSAILSDQVKSLDWKARRTKRKASVAPKILDEVRGKLRALIGA